MTTAAFSAALQQRVCIILRICCSLRLPVFEDTFLVRSTLQPEAPTRPHFGPCRWPSASSASQWSFRAPALGWISSCSRLGALEALYPLCWRSDPARGSVFGLFCAHPPTFWSMQVAQRVECELVELSCPCPWLDIFLFSFGRARGALSLCWRSDPARGSVLGFFAPTRPHFGPCRWPGASSASQWSFRAPALGWISSCSRLGALEALYRSLAAFSSLQQFALPNC